MMVARFPRLALAALSVAMAVFAAGAAGPPPSTDLPDLAPLQAKVYAGEYAQAADQLLALTAQVRHAEVYNLLGYSLRQLKRYEESARWYREALLYDPESRTALEYQGELFLAQGDAESARKNLRYLELLCGTDCREYGLLKQAFADAGVPITP